MTDHNSTDSEEDDDIPAPAEQVEISELAEQIAGDQGLDKPITRSHRAGTFMYRHEFHGTLHWNHKDALLKLACGRKIEAGFKLLADYPAFVSPRCITCFGTDKAVVELDTNSENDSPV